MKATRISGSPQGFQPIHIQVTIESQEELDALQKARRSLTRDEIDGIYDEHDRGFWVRTLEKLFDATGGRS